MLLFIYKSYFCSVLSSGKSTAASYLEILGRLRTPVHEAFSYGIQHISLWFNEIWPYASLNHNEICHIPYENASCTVVHNLAIGYTFTSNFKIYFFLHCIALSIPYWGTKALHIYTPLAYHHVSTRRNNHDKISNYVHNHKHSALTCMILTPNPSYFLLYGWQCQHVSPNSINNVTYVMRSSKISLK